MSFGGILATALAGGANVIGKQAGDDIEAGRKADLMRQQADIEEQMRMRLAEFSEKQRRSGVLWDTTGEAADAKLGYKARELAAQTDAEVGKARALIPVQQEAAIAANDTATSLAKTNAADPTYLKSISVLKLADPEVRARIAQANAAAGASAQSVKESGERLKQLSAVGEVATQVRGLQARLAQTSDPAQRQALEQQITDMGFSGKDIKSFLSTAERAMSNGDTAMKILLDPSADPSAKEAARKQLETANQFATKAAGMAGIKLDATTFPDPPAAAIADLKRDPASAAFFDKTFGPGAAAKVLGKEAPAQKAPAQKTPGMLTATDPAQQELRAAQEAFNRISDNISRAQFPKEYERAKRRLDAAEAAVRPDAAGNFSSVGYD